MATKGVGRTVCINMTDYWRLAERADTYNTCNQILYPTEYEPRSKTPPYALR